jgi:hypothetical protein
MSSELSTEQLLVAAQVEEELVALADTGIDIIYEQWDLVRERVGQEIFDEAVKGLVFEIDRHDYQATMDVASEWLVGSQET